MKEIKFYETSDGTYSAVHDCATDGHVWYYAAKISHWRCEFCGKLEHDKPVMNFFSDEIIRTYIDA